MILVQLLALAAALMAGCGFEANSELKNSNTQAGDSNSALLMAVNTASAASSAMALLPIANPVATFNYALSTFRLPLSAVLGLFYAYIRINPQYSIPRI